MGVKNKPGQRLAYLPTADSELLAETLVALANGDGGLVVMGLDENGRPTETIWEEEAEGALREAARICRPPVPTQWQPTEMRQGTFIGIDVPRSTELHSLEDGRVLLRSGDRNRPLSGDEIRGLAASKHTAEFETEVVPGARPDDLSPDTVREYLDMRTRRGAAPVTDLDRLLFEIGATDRQGNPTLIGILLFGKHPQAFFPQSGVVFVKFPGTEPRGEDGGIGYGRRAELAGPLARVVERAWNLVFEEMQVGATVNDLARTELTTYPRFAVREALVNAIAHRDYRISGRRIEIRMYADRLEIISPGGLPGYMTLDNLVEEHFSRNPRLVNGLYQWGYIEELGLGIDQMIEDMVQAGHDPPQFQATPHSFTVVLSAKRTRPAAPGWTRNMNERQTRALAYIREHGSITNGEYKQLCPNVTAETLRRDLVDLVERGFVLKIGSKKGTNYILK
ncbi:MAG: putative DNA binding domain-containing protein [Anaerolineales bacterium]|nr:putative DNA binding domain-containing protein [Anaerolineales bacterium]